MNSAGVLGMRVQPVPQPQVAAQRGGRGRVQRHQPGLAELGLADGQHPGREVEVWPVEADRLADAHTGDREQPDQGLVGRRRAAGTAGWRLPRSARRCRRRSKGKEWPGRPPRDQIRGRHLGGRVDGVQVGSEPAHCRQPLRMPARIAGGQRRPRQRVLGGDPWPRRVLQVGDELAEQLLGAGELVAKGAADRQVVRPAPGAAGSRGTAWPGPGQCSQRLGVGLGIDRRRQQPAVPQHLPDLGQRRARRQHAGGGRVPQPVREDRADPGALPSGADTAWVTPPLVSPRCGARARRNTCRAPSNGSGRPSRR